MKIRNMAATLAGLLLMALPSFAQSGSSTVIEGHVMGADGKPVQGAIVRIVRIDVNGTWKVKTDKKGYFIDSTLAFGRYDLFLEIDGKVVDKVAGVQTTIQRYVTEDFNLKAQQALKDAASTGVLTKEQERGISPEEKARLEESYKKNAEVMKKNAALNSAYNAGKTALDNKQYDVAIENCTKASELDPKQGAVWNCLALSHQELAKTKTGADAAAELQKAGDSWTKAIELNPQDAGLHNNYALILAASKKFPEAQAELEKAATINPSGAGQYYYNLGALEVNNGQNDAANETFKKAVSIVPPYAEAFYQYGITLLAKASYDKDGKIIPVPGTVEAFQKYLELSPTGKNAQDAKDMLTTLGSTLEVKYKNPDADKKKKKQ